MSTKKERLKLWKKIEKIPEGEVTPSLIRKLSIYKGKAGICRDDAGITISLMHTGRYFPDDIFESGLLYHYPETGRGGPYDQNEIDSTKKCHRLKIPLFIILPGKQVQKRTVKLGWVTGYDESSKLFLVEYGKKLPVTKEVIDDFIGIEERKLKRTLAKTRPNQAKFVLKFFNAMVLSVQFVILKINFYWTHHTLFKSKIGVLMILETGWFYARITMWHSIEIYFSLIQRITILKETYLD